MNGSSVFSQRGRSQGYFGDDISQGGCLFLLKGRAVLEVGVRPRVRLGGAVDVVVVVVSLRPCGFQKLRRE